MRSTKKSILFSSLLASALISTAHAQQKQVEVVHWWTAGSEANALKVLKDDMAKQGYGWKDSAVAGGGGDQARTVLRARVTAGNPPDAMQMLGYAVTEYAEEGLMGNLDAVARKEAWNTLIPGPLQKFSSYQGHWVAVPVGIHRSNWVWANKAIFDELKLVPPKSFDELMAVAEKIRKAGYIPLAHGGQAWQDATMFDSAVLSAGGPEFYKRAMIDLDPKALNSKTMEKAFEQMQKLRTLVDPNFSGRDWNLATAMVANKKAAMQVIGDWAKGELANAGLKANVDYLCFQYPGTQGSFIFLADQFGIFKVSQQQLPVQAAFASAVLNKDFQEKFNLVKGSIPARMDVPMNNFDDCGKRSMADMQDALRSNTMLGSFAHGHAMPDGVKAAAMDVVTKFFNSGKSPAEATRQFAAAVASNQ